MSAKRRRTYTKKIKLTNVTTWTKNTKNKKNRQEKKDRIRNAFSNAPKVEIIPAKYDGKERISSILRVAAYCRVSTYEESQAGSYELQVQYYRELIEKTPNWDLAGIYSDEGVSGTSMRNRIGFLKMIDDCNAGKIDLIITKSVSRFARNTRDCLEVIRQLRALNPPIGVFFELENLNTAESKNEFTLGVMSLVAQGESEAKSAAITWSIIERFKKGIPIISTHNLLGYDKDKFGKVIIVKEEAEIVKYIFESFLENCSISDIAKSLTNAKIPTVIGHSIWKNSNIYRILRNEKYCGDVLMQKTFTVDCFTHKKVKNIGQRPQYLLRGGIPAIIPKEMWLTVQERLLQGPIKHPHTHKPLKKKLFLSKAKTGITKGFIIINPKWRSDEIDQVVSLLNLKKDR